jgi:hypothetical protein
LVKAEKYESFFTEQESEVLRRSKQVTFSKAELEELRGARLTTERLPGDLCGSPEGVQYLLRSKQFVVIARYNPEADGCDHHDGKVMVTARRGGRPVSLTKNALDRTLDIIREKGRLIRGVKVLPPTSRLVVQDRHQYDEAEEAKNRSPEQVEFEPAVHEPAVHEQVGHEHVAQRDQQQAEARFKSLLDGLNNARSLDAAKQQWDALEAIAAMTPNLRDQVPSLKDAYRAAFMQATSPEAIASWGFDGQLQSLADLGRAAELDRATIESRVGEVAFGRVEAKLRDSFRGRPRYPIELLDALTAYAEFVGIAHAAKALRADPRLWKPIEKELADAKDSDQLVAKYTNIYKAPGWEKLHAWLSALPY